MSTPAPDILSVALRLGARSESWLYSQIARLRRHRVHLVAYEQINRAEYPYEPVTLLPSRRSIFFKAVRFATCLLRGLERPSLDFRERSVLLRLLADSNLRVIQAHYAGVACRVREAMPDLDRPFVAWFYGSDVFRFMGASEARVRRLARTDAIFCCTSEALRLRAEELGCPRDRIHVHYPGVEVPEEAPERSPGGRLRIVSVGRLVDFKDPVGLIKVASALRGKGVTFAWQHFGDGELRPRMEDAIRASGIEESFSLMGECPHESVVLALRTADLMVHNAVVAKDGGREAFGVALAEAAAQGLPVVSAVVGGIPEIVADGHTGFLVAEGALDEMVDRISLLWREPDLRISMGRAAHERARTCFDSVQQTERLDAFYDKITADGGSE